MAENMQWYKDRLNIAITCAPATRMKNTGAKQLQKLCKNDRAHALADKFGFVPVKKPNDLVLGFW
jgi:hypothetical protein